MNEQFETTVKTLSRSLAVLAMKNTFLEDLHAGQVPTSQKGDFSDVKVVTPTQEIPWNQLSRFDDKEMKKLMKQVVNKLYTILLPVMKGETSEELEDLIRLGNRYAKEWETAEVDEALASSILRHHTNHPSE